MHKLKHNSCAIASHGKCGLLRNKNCICLDSMCVKSNSSTIAGNDRTIAYGCNYNKCNKTIYQYQLCATVRNFYKDCETARRHLREYHKLRNENDNAIEKLISKSCPK